MTDRGPYSRVYWSVMDDEKFDGIREDARLFGSWSILLVVADMAWPAPAYVPPTVPRSAFARLVDCGLIDEMAGHRYRVHGLDDERNERSTKARESVMHRYHDRTTTVERPNNGRTTSRDEKRKDEPIAPAREGLPHVTALVANTWAEAAGRSITSSGDWPQRMLDELVERQGEKAVAAAIVKVRATFKAIPSPQQLVAALRNHLEPLPSGKDTVAAEREREQAQQSRRRSEATLASLHYAHTEPRPGCPLCQEAA